MFGEGQEHHTLKPLLEGLSGRYQHTGISDDIYKTKAIVTADTGFSNDENNHYLKTNKINAYIPDNQFRSRDPKFSKQKEKYGKRHQDKPRVRDVIPASEFQFDSKSETCICPAGELLSFRGEHRRAQSFFRGTFKPMP